MTYAHISQHLQSLGKRLEDQRRTNTRYGSPGRRFHERVELARAVVDELNPNSPEVDLLWEICEVLDLDHPTKGQDIVIIPSRVGDKIIHTIGLMPLAYLRVAERTGVYVPKGVTVDLAGDDSHQWSATATAWTLLGGHPVEVGATAWYEDVYDREFDFRSATATWVVRRRELLVTTAQVRAARVACGGLLEGVFCPSLEDHWQHDPRTKMAFEQIERELMATKEGIGA